MANTSFLNFKKLDKNTLFIGVAVVGIIVIAVLAFANNNGSFSFSDIFGDSNEKIAQKAIDYINNKGLSSSPASLVSVSSESGLVKMKIKIGGNEFDSYVSKDGKYLFPQVIDMNPPEEEGDTDTQATEEQKAQAAAAITKTDSPMLEAYVVSRCPYGIQMQRAMAEAVKTQPALADYIKVRYMGDISNGKVTAMHGDAEAQENLRQICIREEQPDKYWDYVGCQMEEGDTEGCEVSTGVSSSQLNACISDSSKGLAYAKEDFDLNDVYSVTGSPTLIINEGEVSEFNFGGRSAEAVKSIVCAGFNTEAEFCSTVLNEASAAVSFSKTYESSSGSSSASCE